MGPGYCPVWCCRTEYQMICSLSDFILRWGRFSQFIQTVTRWMWWDFWGWTEWPDMHICTCFMCRVPEQAWKVQDTILIEEKTPTNKAQKSQTNPKIKTFLRKLSSFLYLDKERKLSEVAGLDAVMVTASIDEGWGSALTAVSASKSPAAGGEK